MAVVACPNCGAKNRVDEGRAGHETPTCGRCRTPLPAAAGSDAKPATFTDANFAEQVLGAGSRPVLVDCWAAWCGPCRMIAPAVDQLAAEAAGRWTVGKLDVDANQGVAGQFRVDSIPNLLIFKGGKLVDQVVGLQPKAAIEAKLRQWA